MKKLVAIIICVTMVFAMSLTAFAAGSWEHDGKGWKWNNGDGTYYTNGWRWCDGNNDGKSECYYFSDLGYALTSALTPDGYTVNADGAWIVDQIVQILASSGPGATTNVAAPSSEKTEKTLDQYVATLTYKGVDGTEKATVRIEGENVCFDVVSGKTSAQLSPEKAKEMYWADDHYQYMQVMANDLMNHTGESMNIVETVKTADGVTVYQYTYYGRPTLN